MASLATLTHHDVLGDALQHHLLEQVLHQQETGKVLEDQLFEARQLLGMEGRRRREEGGREE